MKIRKPADTEFSIQRLSQTLKNKQYLHDVRESYNHECKRCKKIMDENSRISRHRFVQTIIQEQNITTMKEAYDCPELWDISNAYLMCLACAQGRELYVEKLEYWGSKHFDRVAELNIQVFGLQDEVAVLEEKLMNKY